jgi:simple sugar transport system ATP-binding protein
LLRLENVDKHFGTVHAVRGVSIAFQPGHIHAVVGENGAGKSTLLRMAAGLLSPDAGTVQIDGKPLGRASAREASKRGVAMVQQSFSLVGGLTALENFVLGDEPCGAFGRIDRAAALARAARAANDVGVAIAWDTRVESMGMGDRQRLEIVRAVGREARTLILDEPTSVLASAEASALYALLHRLASSGCAVVVVTHRLDEVRAHADDISVMRRGSLVETRALARRDDAEARAMTDEIMGAGAPASAPHRAHEMTNDARIELRDVTFRGELAGVTLAVRGGEILGIAGIDGNGQDALVRVAAGLERPDGGTVRTGAVAAVYADRDRDGLVGDASVADNLVLGELPRFTHFGFVASSELAHEAQRRALGAEIVAPDLGVPARTLSGGNRQKIVMARALARADGVDAFVFAQPTQGIDAAAARHVHTAIEGVAARGKAVVVVSSDLAELRELCDRIVVLVRGRVVAELPPDAPEARFGDAMLSGASRAAADPPAVA